jgi:hypothetical protein
VTRTKLREATRWASTVALVAAVACLVPFGAMIAVEVRGANTEGRPLLVYFGLALVLPAVVVALRRPADPRESLARWALTSLLTHAVLALFAVAVLAF